jgi:hypothetical protein
VLGCAGRPLGCALGRSLGCALGRSLGWALGCWLGFALDRPSAGLGSRSNSSLRRFVGRITAAPAANGPGGPLAGARKRTPAPCHVRAPTPIRAPRGPARAATAGQDITMALAKKGVSMPDTSEALPGTRPLSWPHAAVPACALSDLAVSLAGDVPVTCSDRRAAGRPVLRPWPVQTTARRRYVLSGRPDLTENGPLTALVRRRTRRKAGAWRSCQP